MSEYKNSFALFSSKLLAFYSCPIKMATPLGLAILILNSSGKSNVLISFLIFEGKAPSPLPLSMMVAAVRFLQMPRSGRESYCYCVPHGVSVATQPIGVTSSPGC